MTQRDPDPTIDYALFWLEYAARGLKENPSRAAHHWTHHNFSGGSTGWEEPMSQVYFEPRTLEERLLQGKVHEIMLAALEWALAEAEAETPAKWSVFGAMDLVEAYRIATMVVHIDPTLACALKVRLNKICARMGETLAGLAGSNFRLLMGPIGLQW